MLTRTTNCSRTGVSTLTICLILIAVGGSAVPVAASTVLHDTLWMTDNGTYNHIIPSQIGALLPNTPGTLGDMNAADDFTISDTYNITSVTGDFGSTAAFGGEGVLVEFFADTGGAPSAVPVAAAFVTLGSGLSIAPLTLAGVPAGMRMTLDLSSADITLDSGTWWMSMVVVHEITPSQIYRQVRQREFQEGAELHVRDGGVAHGNAYQGTWGTSDWTPISNFSFNDPGDLAMKIVGIPVCGPDVNCDGVVNIFDLLEILSNWGPCPTAPEPEPGMCAGNCGSQLLECACDEDCAFFNDCCPGVCHDCASLAFCAGCDDHPVFCPQEPAPPCPADVTGDTIVNIFDLLEVLANWGPVN